MTDQMIIPTSADLRKYVEIGLYGVHPHIRGRRVPIFMIVDRMRANNWTVVETAYDFTLTEAEVLAALLYYEEHKDEIDRQRAEEIAAFDEMKRLHGDH